jgi:Ser/Thr protein kinase RdoA (MazF antagonist)
VTTEQVLYGTDDAPVSLPVDVDDESATWDRADRDSRGALFVRVLLERHLSTASARKASRGWGNDRVFRFDRDAGDGFVWVTRWDDADDATEFETAIQRYLDELGPRTGRTWQADGREYRVSHLDERTAAVVVGTDGFVEGTTVRTADETVTVRVADD